MVTHCLRAEVPTRTLRRPCKPARGRRRLRRPQPGPGRSPPRPAGQPATRRTTPPSGLQGCRPGGGSRRLPAASLTAALAQRELVHAEHPGSCADGGDGHGADQPDQRRPAYPGRQSPAHPRPRPAAERQRYCLEHGGHCRGPPRVPAGQPADLLGEGLLRPLREQAQEPAKTITTSVPATAVSSKRLSCRL
jgi:hypothetical protein